MTEPALTLGIEEEYLLVDPVSRDLVPDPPAELVEALEHRHEGAVAREFFRCQIEVGTPVCRSIAEARGELTRLRRSVVEEAERHGLALIAASTHPFGTWRPQKHTDRSRYDQLARDLGVPVRRLLICGTHVHAGIEDPNLRIDLMRQVRYFLPHLLSLTTSSPFWQGTDTKLKSYRLAVFSELPRTGMPEEFQSYGEYEAALAALVQAGVIEDGSKIWWDIRPSARFPTLEMRVTDVCTRVEDGLAVAALYQCLLRMLWRLRARNIAWRRYRSVLIEENRWRAMRYGFEEGLIDWGKGKLVPYADLLEEVLAMVAEDAAALGCEAEIGHTRTILAQGTSAHRQLAAYYQALAEGADEAGALRRVVDRLILETKEGLQPSP
jgi:carboxylate-amine ligase